ncbi:MAG: methionyl-tRNA formyltransferase [Gammaproteobacteria bacterium]|nr:methionyl-tRNA formyltransferase [Pseudomonadales bacterium]
MGPLNLVFAGTPEFAARHLESLLDGPHRILAVYTQPDRRAGRGKKLVPGPVKTLALQHGMPVRQPVTLKTAEAQQELRDFQPDLLVVVAYGLLLPEAVLQIPRLGCINVHASLLPRWRGAAPVERALLAGDPETGVTIMQMDAGLDTGAMLLRKTVPIEADDTRVTLEQKLVRAGTEALPYALDHLDELQSRGESQDDRDSTYARKLEKEEALIDWRLPALQIDRQIRAGIGRLPAYCLADSTRLRILEASPEPCQDNAHPGEILSFDRTGMRVRCGEGCLQVRRIQLPGKNPVSIADLLNARQDLLQPGLRLDSPGTAD